MKTKAESPQFVSTGITCNNPASPNRILRATGLGTWLLEYTIRGGALFELDSGNYRSGERELLLIQPEVPQYYEMDRDIGFWDHYWICFHPRPDWLPLMDWEEISKGIMRLKLDDSTVHERVLQCFEQIINVAHGPLPRRRFLAMTLLEQILLWSDSENPASETNRIDSRVQKAMAYLCAHYRERIGLEQVALAAGLSVSRLAHLFSEEAGLSPMQYLEKHRVEMARQRLIVTTEPVSAVAEWVGYESPSYFTKVFREATGSSPRDFRKMHAGEAN